MAATQFNILTALGLRENHTLLDIGCGSLRAGRLFIPYLLPGNYFGLEPDRWLLNEGVEREIGRDQLRIKRPIFDHNMEFRLSVFGRKFDFILAQSIFTHATPRQIEQCLDEAKRVMHEGSSFCATYLNGESTADATEWQYPSCVTYTEERMLSFAAKTGLVATAQSWPHPNGHRWLLITSPGTSDR